MKLFKIGLLAAALGLAGAAPVLAQGKTTVTVQYPLGFIFDKVFVELKDAFEKANPDITINTCWPTRNTRMPRKPRCEVPSPSSFPTCRCRRSISSGCSSTARSRPTSHPFNAGGKGLGRPGLLRSMMALSTYGGKPYGLAFAASTPIIYVNDDLVTKAGGDPANFPTTWDGIFDLSKKIAATGDGTIGLFYSWAITGKLDVAGPGLLSWRQDDERRREERCVRSRARQEVD